MDVSTSSVDKTSLCKEPLSKMEDFVTPVKTDNTDNEGVSLGSDTKDSTQIITPGGTILSSSQDIKSKNADYFRKLKEEELLAQKEKESKMDADQLRKLKESQDETAKHELNKTAHFAKLGKTFARGSALLSPGGRGSGRGRGR